MIFHFYVYALVLTSIIATISIAFSPSRSIMISALVTLSSAITLLGMAFVEVNTIFWISSTHFILDIATLYFVFSANIQAKPTKINSNREKMYFISVIFAMTFLFLVGIWQIWGMSSTGAGDNTASSAPVIYSVLWQANWPVILCCFLLLSPTAIGALLMVRTKERTWKRYT